MFGPIADLIAPAYKGEAAALTLGNTQGVVVSIQRSVFTSYLVAGF